MSRQLGAAAEKGDVVAIARLLDGGADPEWSRGRGRTALVEASIAGQLDAVTLLLDRGADIDARCVALGYTALGWAACTGSCSIATLLVERGADLESIAPETRRTALMTAAQVGHDDVVRLLLGAGADPNRVDRYGDTAWSLAQSKGHGAVMALLEGAGAGAPEPRVVRPALPWPDPVPGAEATSDPVTVVRAYTLVRYEWERSSHEAYTLARVDRPGIEPLLATSDQIRDKFCTPRRRVYTSRSFGFPTEYSPDDELVAVRTVSAARVEVEIRDEPTRVMVYEHRFVVKRVAGRWLIDNVTDRLDGHETWERSYL